MAFDYCLLSPLWGGGNLRLLRIIHGVIQTFRKFHAQAHLKSGVKLIEFGELQALTLHLRLADLRLQRLKKALLVTTVLFTLMGGITLKSV
ncbi:hypothetical protein B9K09_04770 [Pseudomonas sp. M30-35]|nr:hypothetical protein B9K09_04770 [Pseudomonas sp. M30-35]